MSFGRRAILLCTFAAAGFFALPWAWLRHWEADTADFRLRLRGAVRDVPPVVIVSIEESSFSLAERVPDVARREPVLARMGQPWPWDRRVFAAVLDQLARAGARAVAFDIVFVAETAGDPEFAAALAAAPLPVILARQYEVGDTLEGERSVTVIEPRAAFTRGLPRVSTGYANIWPDDDQVVRTTRLSLTAGELLGDAFGREPREPSFALAVARALGGALPAAPHGGIVNYAGPGGTIPRVPIEHLFLADRWNGSVLARGEFFRDRIVVIGPGSEVRFKDYHATPFGLMAGAEVQANLIASITGRGLLWALPAWLDWLAVALAAALAGGVCLRAAGPVRQLLVLSAALVTWLLVAQLVLLQGGGLLPVAAPSLALLTAGLGGIAVRYVGEQRERRRLRNLLGSYVSEQIAAVIVSQPESLAATMRGERRPVTVLFSDLRGFTRLSEERPAAELVTQLNEYLHATVDCILAEGGTVQKFIGDAILAVWGDTHSAGEAADAERAVAAALAMDEALARLNAGWAARVDRVPLRMGVGLQHGVVTVGNIGHPRRMEFGVLGDAVNTASRLEGATKHLGLPLLVGEPVARLAAGRFRFASVARLGLAGRAAPVEVFTPIGRADEPEPLWQNGYQKAVALLQAGEFAAARANFATLAPDAPRARELVAFQAQRAEALAAHPPASWDGTLRLEEK
ncbi:MAG: adenylate/guanylate cyclase domain-containing protein [Opitutae bacterium]|nr:adenylate/guanylate cyclase domain-containing protein [Opitutae bacterium]